MVIGRKAILDNAVRRGVPEQTPHVDGFGKGTREEEQLVPEIQGGPDVPTIFPRVTTQSEIRDLQERLMMRENELLGAEESCRVCGETFEYGSFEVCVLSLNRRIQVHML